MGDADQPEAPAQALSTVFFSYSRADQKAAQPVIRALEDAGFSVWWDGLLGGGERFAHATAAALERARAVVVLWSKTSIDSHWVHDEATSGRERRVLVPVSLDGSMPPLGFRQFQTIDLSRGLRRGSPDLQRVVDAVATLHERPPAPVPTPRPPRPDRRALMIGGATLVAAGGGAAAWWTLFRRPAGVSANTVAVLPFDNVSGQAGQTYFAEGLSAEVRAALARNAVLRVVGQTSSDVFRNHAEDAKAISRKLGVAFLLDGNVRQSGNRVRISAELIDGQTGFSRWSQTFDRGLDDIFAVQTEIAGAVTSALTDEVGAAAQAQGLGGTQNVAAFDAYLRGRAAFNLAQGEATDRDALARFDEAIAKDPRFAVAQAARSRSLAVIANQYAEGAERRAFYDKAIAGARRAVELAPKLADAQSALGYALFNRLDIRAAREPYDQSYALGQGDPDVLGRFALYCARTGRFDEANRAISQAAELDPLNPRTFRTIGIVKYASRHYEEVMDPAARALALNPAMANVTAEVGYAKLMLGQVEEANADFAKERNPLFRLPGLAIVAQRTGRADDARRTLEDLVRQLGDNGLYQQAQILAQWGDKAGAVNLLRRARRAGDSGLILAKTDPLLDPIRGEPDFVKLLRELGFA